MRERRNTLKLTVVGSSSAGNCYLLENQNECLIIEAGVSLMEVKKALNFNIKKIVGVIASHVHLDHSKYISEFERIGIPVFKPYDGMKSVQMPNSRFIIQAFPLVHSTYNIKLGEMEDCPCYGFHIQHEDIGTLVYASDTEFIKWRFANVNHFLVECNYDMKYVDRSMPNYSHILSGHLSLDTCKEFLRVNNSTSIRSVTLCHLSASNSDSNEFREEISKVVDCDVKIAKKGLIVDLDLNPF